MSLELSELDTNVILKALDYTAQQQWLSLAEHPLAQLQAVALVSEENDFPLDGIGRGKALAILLKKTAADLVADETGERAGQILEARLQGIHPKTAAPDMGLSVDRWYALQRDEAVPRLQTALWETEQTARQQRRQRHLLRHLPPPSYTRLFGVTGKLTQLTDTFAEKAQPWLISLEGMGGIGKTALAHAAVSWAAGQEMLFVDIAWVTAKQQRFTWQSLQQNQRPTLTFEILLDTVADQLGLIDIARLPTKEKTAALAATFKQKPYLLVVDNLETALDYESLAAHLWQLVNPSKILLTTRQRLSGYEGVFALPLHVLAEADALSFMRYYAAELGLTVFAEATDDDLRQIHQACGGHPLAIQLIVGQVATLPLERVLSSLQQVGQNVETLYRYLYWHAWELLSDTARLLLVRLPLLPPDGGGWDDLAALSGFDDRQLAAAIKELVTHSLLPVSGGLSKRYAIHPLTRNFVLSEIVRDPGGDSDNG